MRFFSNVVQEAWGNIAQENILFNVVLIKLGQHCTGKHLVQSCPRASRQHSTQKILLQCCLNTLWITLHMKKSVHWCLNALAATLHTWFIVGETLDNIPHGKFLLNVILILLEQHCTSTILVLCFPRGSRQHCTGKIPVQCRLNIVDRTPHR